MTDPHHLRAVPREPAAPGDAATVAAELLRATARGDKTAFERLFNTFAARVYGLAHRIIRDPGLAEEVAQEVFTEIWQRASRFDPSRGTAAGWILQLTHGRAVDRVRSLQAARDREQKVHARSTEREVDTVVEQVESSLERAAVRRCLATLTEIQQESVQLAYFSGYTYPEVARLLSVPLGTVKTRMRDGLIRLRDCLRVTA